MKRLTCEICSLVFPFFSLAKRSEVQSRNSLISACCIYHVLRRAPYQSPWNFTARGKSWAHSDSLLIKLHGQSCLSGTQWTPNARTRKL